MRDASLFHRLAKAVRRAIHRLTASITSKIGYPGLGTPIAVDGQTSRALSKNFGSSIFFCDALSETMSDEIK